MRVKTVKDMLSTKEVGEVMRVHPCTIVRWINDGLIPAINISKGNKPCYKIAREDLPHHQP